MLNDVEFVVVVADDDDHDDDAKMRIAYIIK